MSNFQPEIVGDNYLLRLLSTQDSAKQYCQLLSHLTDCPILRQENFQALLSKQMHPDHGYYIMVIEDLANKKLLASVTLLIEQKIIHQAGKVGHIEDVVVAPEARKQGLAGLLLSKARQVASGAGCYKIILDCEPALEKFYQKYGYFKNGNCMRSNL